jgi:hypothetical protein
MSQLGLDAVSEAAWTSEGTWGSRALSSVKAGPLLFPRYE